MRPDANPEAEASFSDFVMCLKPKTQHIDFFFYTQWFKSQNKIGANSQLN